MAATVVPDPDESLSGWLRVPLGDDAFSPTCEVNEFGHLAVAICRARTPGLMGNASLNQGSVLMFDAQYPALRVANRFGLSVACLDAHRASLTASGELDLAAACDLSQMIATHCAAGRRYVRLDLSGVTFMDCTCLGVLVAAHFRLLAANGNLILTGVMPPVSTLFFLTGLDHTLLATAGSTISLEFLQSSSALAG